MAFDLAKPTFIFPDWIPLGTIQMLPVTEIAKVELGTVMTAENGRQYIYTRLDIPSSTAATVIGSPVMVDESGLNASLVIAGTAALPYNAMTILPTPATTTTTTFSFFCVFLLSLGGGVIPAASK